MTSEILGTIEKVKDYIKEENKFSKGAFGTTYSFNKDGKRYVLKETFLNMKGNINEKNISDKIKGIENKEQFLFNYIEYFDFDNKTYFVSEYMGISLRKDLETHKDWKIDEIIDFAKQILYSLNLLHTNLIYHRDIKPENICIRQTEKEPKKEYIIIDYGSGDIDSKKEKKTFTKKEYEDRPFGTSNYLHPKINEIYHCDKEKEKEEKEKEEKEKEEKEKEKGKEKKEKGKEEKEKGKEKKEKEKEEKEEKEKEKEKEEVKTELYNWNIDIWSLGLICLELFTGEHLFNYLNKNNENKEHNQINVKKEDYRIPLDKRTTVEFVQFIDNMLQYDCDKQLNVEELGKLPFLKSKKFTEFPIEVAKNKGKYEEIKDDKGKKEYLKLNFRNELNFDYDKLLKKDKKVKSKDELFKEIFLELIEEELFTEPVLIPLIKTEDKLDIENNK